MSLPSCQARLCTVGLEVKQAIKWKVSIAPLQPLKPLCKRKHGAGPWSSLVPGLARKAFGVVFRVLRVLRLLACNAQAKGLYGRAVDVRLIHCCMGEGEGVHT